MAESVTLTVTGMKCAGCEANVNGKLTALDGVISVAASRLDKAVKVEFDSGKTSVDIIKAAIKEAGYMVES